jgi:tetratricopeptide (TPR) repeat protein
MAARPRLLSMLLVATLVAPSALVWADGKRDLDDGIAFYENLDTERAIERLRAASRAQDLSASEQARALMYLGIVLFETGREREAEAAWQSAVGLNRKVSVPSGTSPKIVQAIERVRASAPGSPATPDGPRVSKPPVPTPTPTPSPTATPEPTTKSPYADPTPPIDAEPELVAPVVPPPEEDDDGGVPGWLIWTGIAAAVAGGAVAGILIATSGPSCNAGACLLVELK